MVDSRKMMSPGRPKEYGDGDLGTPELIKNLAAILRGEFRQFGENFRFAHASDGSDHANRFKCVEGEHRLAHFNLSATLRDRCRC